MKRLLQACTDPATSRLFRTPFLARVRPACYRSIALAIVCNCMLLVPS
jgi:hypothetical protein